MSIAIAGLMAAVLFAPAPRAVARADESGAEEALADPPAHLRAPGPFEFDIDLERTPLRGTGRDDGGTPTLWGWQLAAFLATLAAAVAMLRGIGPRRETVMPGQPVALLGSLALGTQHGLRVVRFGRRMLLVAISPNGCQLLAETDAPLPGTEDGTDLPLDAPAAPAPGTATVPPGPTVDRHEPAPAAPPASRGAA